MSVFDSPEGKLEKYTKEIKELNKPAQQQKLVDFCNRMLEKHYNDFFILNGMYSILESEKLYALAEIFVNRTIQIDPTNYHGYVLKALSLFGQTKYEECFANYDIAISMAPDDTTLWFDKAVTLQEIDLHEDAIDLLKRILKKHPTQVKTINALVYSLLAEKKFEEVRKYNEKALKINPSDPEALAQKQELQKVFGQNF
jgi:tetratricopeptide (TPR) repeat protein